MTKEGLVAAVVKKVKCTKACSVATLNAILDEIKKSLAKGQKVVLTGFGTFSVVKRAARIGRNPQTGKTLKIPAKKVAKFKAGTELKKAVK